MPSEASNNKTVTKSITEVVPIIEDAYPRDSTRASYQFKISYSQIKDAPFGVFYTSPKFTVGRSNYQFYCFPEASWTGEKGYMNFGISRFEYASAGYYNLYLLDKHGKPSSVAAAGHHYSGGVGREYSIIFMRRDTFESRYLANDCITVICDITLVAEEEYSKLGMPGHVVTPPSTLQKDFGSLLESTEMTDVTFEVDGEIISAHRIVLAARSEVFKAKLYGPMAKDGSERVIIKDIEAPIFKLLLHYIYTDTLFEVNDSDDSDNIDATSGTMIAQHLLEAADRFALESLKLKCETKLARDINVEIAATTLVLAVQHNCHNLKTRCFEFITAPGNLLKVMGTEGFIHLVNSCPEVWKEVLSIIDPKSHISFKKYSA